MSLVSTKTPIFDDIPSIEFFNGRLLSGEDMTIEQAWNAARRKLLGQALGSGVAFGLEVSASKKDEYKNLPVVTVEPGLALNAVGEILSLNERTDVSLVHIEETQAPSADFAACLPTQFSAYVKSDGVYLLSLCPASGTQGRAPVMGLANEEARCNRKYRREGVQFRLHQLKLTADELDSANRNKLRNLVAYKCFNPGAWQAFVTDPFGATGDQPKLLDGLLVPKLDDSEVPLATVFWTTDGGIEYVDLWSVRQLLAAVPAISESLSGHPRLRIAGEARALQFAAQLQDLIRESAGIGELRIRDHFRYIPPAGHVPVIGMRSPRGVRPATFFGTSMRGLPATMQAGVAATVVTQSLAFPPVDLERTHCLQLFDIAENLQAIESGDTQQKIQLYVDRSLNGPVSRDSVTEVFEDAWEVYRGLIRRRVFVPVGATPEETAAQITVVGAMRDIMEIATRQASKAAAWALNSAAALDAFRSLFTVQQDLGTLLGSPMPGVPDNQSRVNFANGLDTYLTGNPGGGVRALGPTLDAGDLCAAIAAQNAINAFVGRWSGEGVAVGPVTLIHLDSPDGTNVVPNGDWFRHRFQLLNGTDRRLTFSLDAQASATTGDWQGTTTIHNGTTGQEISSIAVAFGSQALLEVRVRAPQDAQVGETAALQFTATASPPNDAPVMAAVELAVEAEEGEPVTRTLEFVGNALTPNGQNSITTGRNTLLSYGFNVRYNATTGPAEADFDFTVAFATGQAEPWVVAVEVPEVLPVGSPPGTFTRRIRLRSGDQEQINVFIRTPNAASAGSFQFRVTSADLTPALAAQRPEIFSITVT